MQPPPSGQRAPGTMPPTMSTQPTSAGDAADGRLTPEPGSPAGEVMRRTRVGVFLSVVTGIFTRLIGLLTTLLLAHYMTPEQSGSVNLALNVVNLISVLTTIGLGQYVASQASPSPKVAWNATQIHLITGLVAFAITYFGADGISWRLGAASGARYIPLFLVVFSIERLVYVPERVLIAHLRFGQLGILRSAGELSYCVGALAAALYGLGPWSILAGNLLRQTVRFALAMYFTPRHEWLLAEAPDFAVWRTLLHFGLPVMVATIAGFASRRGDNLLVSRYYGPAVLGLYNLAYNLAEIPAMQITDMVTDSLAPSFARLEQRQRQRAITDILAALCFVVFPLAVGLGLVAPTLGQLIDRRWAGVADYLVVLSVLSISRPAAMVALVYLQALRKPTAAAVLYSAQVVVLLGSLFLVGHYYPTRPILGCYAVGLTFTLSAALSIGVLRRLDGVPIWPVLRGHLVPLPPVVMMAVAVLGATQVLGPVWLARAPWALLIAQILVGGVAYAGAALLILPTQTRRLIKAVRDLRRKKD